MGFTANAQYDTIDNSANFGINDIDVRDSSCFLQRRGSA